LALGLIQPGLARVLLVVVGVLLMVVGWTTAGIGRLTMIFTRAVPENGFGICSGIGKGPNNPGFTDWLSDRIDEAAGLEQRTSPLTFGQLQGGPGDAGHEAESALEEIDPEAQQSAADTEPSENYIDLRMVTTCLSQGKPYELPGESHRFFYRPEKWRNLFPKYVMDYLDSAPPAQPLDQSSAAAYFTQDQAATRAGYRRLPAAVNLPVIVATRLSLSFPLLISAIPLSIVRQRGNEIRFVDLWFTDGGLCSNFPVHMFDAPLPTRPTFAINLGTMGKSWHPSPNQDDNLRYARNNSGGLTLPAIKIPRSGLAALAAFTANALNTSRNWTDNMSLRYPGHRDRTVVVLQSKNEGGLNLYMDSGTILSLADRGRAAAAAITNMFRESHYVKDGVAFTGWDNHRWLRYRALLSALPAFLNGYAAGRAALNLPNMTPSYKMSAATRAFAEQNVLAHLDAAAREIAGADCGHRELQRSRFCGQCGVPLVGHDLQSQTKEPSSDDESTDQVRAEVPISAKELSGHLKSLTCQPNPVAPLRRAPTM
jgi:hypothetical protein